MELGVLSLSDLQSDPATGQRVSARIRTQDIISYGILADQLGLDVFALGEHHSLYFAVSSPVVELYRQAGAAAGHPADSLRLGLTSHFFIGPTSQGSREAFYPYYREYLRPKTPGGRAGPSARRISSR